MHHNVKSLVGQTFGRWTVIAYNGQSHWQCRCECGTERPVFTGNLKGGKSTSCGCLRDEIVSSVQTTHGLTRSAEYKVWAGIKRRCLNPRDQSYVHYGAVGVTICPQWADSFETFLADVGTRPSPQHTIDRIDNSNGYEPDNCRWATRAEQNRNKRNNRFLTFRGKTQTIAEWSRETGLHHSLIQCRLSLGWSVEAALTRPPVLGRNQFSE